ncbi:uncharacterized protein V1518DRAFT_408073 [Limtongia smithiae]|uniref:uncharacterized protein n=1 Tax=Limtongia smithiae TaxID=1125753 RepID=UPI0034D01E3B
MSIATSAPCRPIPASSTPRSSRRHHSSSSSSQRAGPSKSSTPAPVAAPLVEEERYPSVPPPPYSKHKDTTPATSTSRKKHRHRKAGPPTDWIDKMDPTSPVFCFHHEGPYDPAAKYRNKGPNAPVKALNETSAIGLKLPRTMSPSTVAGASRAVAPQRSRPTCSTRVASSSASVASSAMVLHKPAKTPVLPLNPTAADALNPALSAQWPGAEFAVAPASSRREQQRNGGISDWLRRHL